jgi:hypothetical protein
MAAGGIVGTRNYQYCLFGETVKTVSFQCLHILTYTICSRQVKLRLLAR